MCRNICSFMPNEVLALEQCLPQSQHLIDFYWMNELGWQTRVQDQVYLSLVLDILGQVSKLAELFISSFQK